MKTNVPKNLLRRWLKNIKCRTKEEKSNRWWSKLMRRMANTNIRTLRGQVWVQRNDPCPCGKVYDGVLINDPNNPGEKIEKPVKFKYCCWATYATTKDVTSHQLTERVKRERYFDKHRKLPK